MAKDRSSRRFWLSEPLDGFFDGVPVTVRDIAEKGVQIEHRDALPQGCSGFISYTIPGRQKPIEVHGQVRWTQPVKGQQNLYRSGIFVDAGGELLNASIDLLIRKGMARLDPPPAQRPSEPAAPGASASWVEPLGHEPSPKVVAMIEDARNQLATSFDTSMKWYNRARFSMSDPTVQREVRDIRCKEDVLAVWEFLGRSVDIHIIARVFDRR